ncbi:hypothetical protein Catovirus_1_377 [Catovirus CTV1]|uniref:Uncharacterized protein n=1 Tax=Catovirus CTV1 TaxID=1977631 RepID=A0A1V0S9D2_9VIRU|nr:hypothetical protein Catovirus_1_377 [Catovirus CTV1]
MAVTVTEINAIFKNTFNISKNIGIINRNRFIVYGYSHYKRFNK